MSHVMTATVDGVVYTIDLDRLTLGEGRAVEKVTGADIADAMRTKSLTSIQAILWVTMKRVTPTLKFGDLDDLVIADIDLDIAADEEVAADPTPAEPAA